MFFSSALSQTFIGLLLKRHWLTLVHTKVVSDSTAPVCFMQLPFLRCSYCVKRSAAASSIRAHTDHAAQQRYRTPPTVAIATRCLQPIRAELSDIPWQLPQRTVAFFSFLANLSNCAVHSSFLYLHHVLPISCVFFSVHQHRHPI